jgi:hypothetical protein
MNEYRVRLTDDQLKFLLLKLRELEESYEERLHFYRSWKKEHVKDFDRTEFDRANTAVSETVRERIVTRDFIRRFQSLINGGKPRPSRWANIACAMFVGWEQEDV